MSTSLDKASMPSLRDKLRNSKVEGTVQKIIKKLTKPKK